MSPLTDPPVTEASPPAAGGGSTATGFLRWLPWLALAAALVGAWLPLAVPETVAGQSTMSDRIRAEAMHAAVAAGDLFPAWLPDLYDRHGTPLPSFYSPLAYYLVELARRLTTDSEQAFKLAYLACWILGSLGAAMAARQRFGVGAGVPAAAAFALAPYTLVDVYVRSGIAEFAALALIPWALAALASTGALLVGGTALVMALLVLTHNITALIAAPVLAILAILGEPGARRRALTGIALGLAFSLFFWLPALVETRWLWSESSLTTGFFDYRRHFVAALDLLPWRTSLHFTIGPSSGLAFRFGELLLLAAIAPVLALACAKSHAPRDHKAALLLAAGASAALFLTTSWSEPLWRILPLAHYVQFPFRFFLFATVLATPLVGWLVVQAPSRRRPLLAALVTALALLTAHPWLGARYCFVDRATGAPIPILGTELERARREPRFLPVQQFVTLDRLRSSHWSGSAGNEFLPLTVTVLPATPPGLAPTVAAEAVGPGIRVLSSSWAYPEVRAEIEVREAGEVALHQFWFPGWSATVDGTPRASRAEPGRGRILVAVEPGDREVQARFGPTPLRRICGLASLLALFGVAAASWIGRRGAVARSASGPAAPVNSARASERSR